MRDCSIKSIRSRRGLSLISLMIAIALLAILMLTNVATLIYSARTARINSYRLAARNVVQGVLEQMYAHPYDNVTQSNFPSIPLSNPNAELLDSVNDLRCDLTVEIEDERQATSASSNTLVCTGAGWESGRWDDDTVFITGGRGFGQRARILSSSADTLSISLLGFPGQTDWISTPDASSRFLINGGKTVRIMASFTFRDQIYTEMVEGLVVHDD
jgi:Tfp pilus assembly protein PilE